MQHTIRDMSNDCPTDLFNSTQLLYVFQPIVADKGSFTAVSVGLAVFNLALGLYMIGANCGVVLFYRGKVEQVVPLLYTFISSNDVLSGNVGLGL